MSTQKAEGSAVIQVTRFFGATTLSAARGKIANFAGSISIHREMRIGRLDQVFVESNYIVSNKGAEVTAYAACT